MILGVKRGTVRIIPYQEKWKEVYALERKILKAILGTTALAIEHIGSTAVEDLQAKPIIDIAVKVENIKEVQSFFEKLVSIGYQERVGRLEGPQRVFANQEEDIVTHHLHFIQTGYPEWERKLLFREYLRANEAARQEYEKLKLDLFRSFSDQRGTYTKMKKGFIESVVEKAKKEGK